MGGKIDVDSQIGKGTRFEIRFPIENKMGSQETGLSITAIKSSKTNPENGHVFSKKLKLLLVDDEEGFVKVLSKRLEKRNIEVTTALSGVEGIQALRKVDFDVAILDLKMEDMDGLEVLKIFKKMYANMQIIILSGHESEQAARDGIKYGAAAYLAKPCNFEELIDTIKTATSQ
jgi:ActR/RegA family two-component response regulator